MKGAVAANREWIAYHEAGHAVAAHYYNYQLTNRFSDGVTIRPAKDGSNLGHCAMQSEVWGLGNVDASPEILRAMRAGEVAAAWREATISMAGPMAEKRFRRLKAGTYPGAGGDGDGGDVERALETLARAHGEEKKYEEEKQASFSIYLASRDAQNLFRRRGAWAAVEALAAALLKSGTVKADRAHRIIEKTLPGGAGRDYAKESAEFMAISGGGGAMLAEARRSQEEARKRLEAERG